MAPYERTFEIRWSDCDPNRHARHTVYGDYATHVRFAFLNENGFPPGRFEEIRFGPVVLSEEIEYFREVVLGERIRIDFEKVGLSADGVRWRVRHNIWKENGKQAARITMNGGWLNLDKRKLTRPPDDLVETLARLEPAPDFAELPSAKRL